MPRRSLFKTDACDAPYDFIEVQRTGDHPLPAEFRDRVLIHTIHDGAYIPKEFIYTAKGKPRIDLKALQKAYVVERDWGANLIAHKIAAALGVAGYARCRVARVLIDFNRFPGSTPHDGEGVRPLERLAINKPFSSVLSHAEKVKLLESFYDRISETVEPLLMNRLIMIAVHTYDEHNPTMTRRPHLSLLNSVLNYQREQRMPFGVFDPMYPDVLGESTCSRILRDRISLNLERNGFRVTHNHPYPLPAGSMEVRAQVWFFFTYLRKRFEMQHPETIGDKSYELVWLMLMNTNLRLAEAEALRSYLHRYRRIVAPAKKAKFQKARFAYAKIESFLEGSNVLDDFRRGPERPSSIGLEVRKDLLCTFNEDGRPIPSTREQIDKATLIGNTIANAITTYFETDRQYL